MNETVAYNNINPSEGVGFTANIIIKGVAQLGGQTLDSALSSQNDLPALLALGLVLAALGFIVIGVANVKGAVKRVI